MHNVYCDKNVQYKLVNLNEFKLTNKLVKCHKILSNVVPEISDDKFSDDENFGNPEFDFQF